MKPIAVVIPWFGKDLKGGAEQQARQVALRLAKRGYSIEVLTSCCRAFHDDWGTNHLNPGIYHEDGILIRRYPVVYRNRKAFNLVNSRALGIPHSKLKPGVNPLSQNESTLFVKENINSAALLEYLERYRESYHAFIFLPYLYGMTINGIPLVSDRAFLQPCLHDEVYAYLPEVDYIFHKAKCLLFNSPGELSLGIRLYGPGIIGKSFVVGEGVEVRPNPERRSAKIRGLDFESADYVLYLGRRDSTKNIDLLLRTYAFFREKNPDSSLNLVLAGPGSVSYKGFVDGVKDFGRVSEKEKASLLKHCLALFQPSQNESYSRVVMEAWFYNKPVAVHGKCLATAGAVRAANGGWIATTETEWFNLFNLIVELPDHVRKRYGEKGKEFAKENADWNRVMDRYESVLENWPKPKATAAKRLKNPLTIHQMVAGFAYGDAISNYVLEIREYLRDLGYKSSIFAQNIDIAVAKDVRVLGLDAISDRDGIIYNHSIDSNAKSWAVRHPGPKCLVYHNITPAKFFEPYRPDFAALLKRGRADLKRLAKSFSLAVGVSKFNVSELIEAGFENVHVLPIPVSPQKWDFPAKPEIMASLSDGRANLLFVGRISPNKCQDDLVLAFSFYLSMDPGARLIIVGNFQPGDPYYIHVVDVINEHGLWDNVILTGKVTDAELQAYYRTADLFWSMSEHEGFGVPLIEAMWFDVPVLAYKSSAVPETLGDAGMMFTTKEDLLKVAALAKCLVRDGALKEKVLRAQRKRREHFLPGNVWPKLDALISAMLE